LFDQLSAITTGLHRVMSAAPLAHASSGLQQTIDINGIIAHNDAIQVEAPT
jgi:hypothetical protein